jgi:U3 small nucleolar RNA-associated protein 12
MIYPITTLPLSSKHRVSQIAFHPTRSYLAVQSHDRSVEIFRIRTEDEVRKKQARRKKRAKEKKEQAKSKGKEAEQEHPDNDNADAEITIPDLFTPYLVIRATGKVRSFDFADEESPSATAKGVVSIFLALANNALEVYSIPQPTKSKENISEATRTLSLDLPGHRADVRSLCLSSDDVLLASAANGEIILRCY